MFRKLSLLSLTGLLLVFLAWGKWIVSPQGKAQAGSSLLSKQEASLLASSSAYQTREKVRKDIWFSQEDHSRLHYRIDSRASILTLIPGKHKIDVIENLQDIRCWMQDKLFVTGTGEAMQQMRFFAADQGTYQYSAQQFVAKTVALSLFRQPGHDLVLLPSSPFLTGIAQDVSFSVSGKSPMFQAQHFKASLAGGTP